MIVQRIKLGAGQDADAFVGFMRDEFIPAMQRGPTRIGQASYIEFLQGNTESTLDEFVLLIDGLMSFHPRFVGVELEQRFSSFAPEIERIADDFRTVALWREPGASASA